MNTTGMNTLPCKSCTHFVQHTKGDPVRNAVPSRIGSCSKVSEYPSWPTDLVTPADVKVSTQQHQTALPRIVLADATIANCTHAQKR